ncbi:MAG TPA: redox-regulated ATPase YchF [Firmicutes bacterium]|nr:redox-regulated ATPase YchF [Bacillota bacterium]
MQVGLIGLPQVGKTTIFEAMASAQGKGASHMAVTKVYDPRVERLSEIFNPRKTTYAQITIVDHPGLTSQNQSQIFNKLQDMDVIVHIVRQFSAPHVPHVEGSISPLRDAKQVFSEIILADWQLLETRITRGREEKNPKKRAIWERELPVLNRCKEALEAEQPLFDLTFDEDEEAILRNYALLTMKSFIVVLNVEDVNDPADDELVTWCQDLNIPLIKVCGQLEKEIAELEPEEQADFLADAGIEQPSVHLLAQTIYDSMKLISFFTVGDDEVKAWTVRQGDTALTAAGKIHSDIARGFIRAEVVNYDTFITKESMAELRKAGLIRLEGKEYLVQDGDIIHFRFNV